MKDKLITVLLTTLVILLVGNLVRPRAQEVSESCGDHPRLYSADANGDGQVALADAVHLLNWLFAGGEEPVCLAQEGLGRATPEQLEILSYLSLVEADDGRGGTTITIRVSGANLQIVNGQGKTESTNGTGNLIVGYNERAKNRSGSHNVIAGSGNAYASYGGLAVGVENTISAPFAVVSGGRGNRAEGAGAAVSGGQQNIASGEYASVSGGQNNRAVAHYCSVSGGAGNTAGDLENNRGWASVTGGAENRAVGNASTVSGGKKNQSGGWGSAVGGGNSKVENRNDHFRGGSLVGTP